MNRLQIPVLPHIVNAIVLTSIFSTGSSFMFCSTRALHLLAMQGQAPKFFARTNRWGTPYNAVGIVALFGCLSYLTLSSSAAVGESSTFFGALLNLVLVWFTNLTTACTLMTWIVIGM